MIISYSYGIIDFLHYGHIRLLESAKKESDLLILGLISDKAILSWHGTLVSSYEERLSVLRGVKYVDEIRQQDSFDPLPNLRSIHEKYPDAKIILYVGNDRNFVPSEVFLKEIGGEVKVVDYYEKLSPQNILDCLTTKSRRKRNNSSNLISTKANTLLALKSILQKGYIEDIYIVSVRDYINDFSSVYQRVLEIFQGDKIVVRSSSVSEDCLKTSNAGHYESVLNVDSSDSQEVKKALEKVSNSYDEKLTENYLNEQILIQRQTKNVICSGVIFTRDVDSNLPYYLINYADGSSTDSVTSGSGGSTIWILRKKAKSSPPLKWKKLLEVVRELEFLLNKMVLDIEFAITSDDRVVIFQVRPLAANYKFQVRHNDEMFYRRYESDIQSYKEIKNYRTSRTMLLSDMAFWNPVEIIGVNPHNLDYSLYREIITRQAWNEGLLPLGYKRVPDELMFRIGNKPYISLDYSFMALTPSILDDRLRDKLCDYYHSKILEDKSAHDKIEFEIVFSCFDFSTKKRLEELERYGFSRDEISTIGKHLHVQTENILRDYSRILSTDQNSLRELEGIRCEIEKNREIKGGNLFVTLQFIYRLLSALKKLGTPQFSRQARCAFISSSFCKSMVVENLLSKKDMDMFMSSLHTVASCFDRDFKRFLSGALTVGEFHAQYGHLRCGTYDIQSPRYDQIDFYQGKSPSGQECVFHKEVELPLSLINALENNLGKLEFSVPMVDILSFMRRSLEQREYFKFEFTKSLSLILELLGEIGVRMDLTLSDMSYLEISDVYAAEYYPSCRELKEFWMTLISKRKEIFKEKSMLILPEVVADSEDLEMIEQNEARPNFVTTCKVEAETISLEGGSIQELQGKIVVITQADPGYDWIFTKGILGLVTKYGGAASHMAIRCAEFSLPAAIGCGEKIYDYVSRSERIELDCGNQKINRIY
ncbi:hypothetical protein DWX23_09650 [Parabacteroides sp. AF18-52]|jgi:hypothetical protein|uniref:PEP/pyruvate-binding domain-containing protein n=1 Tax=Parabacteroides TaxID=375288 RepID=UPI000EFFCFFC|nr:PEP/pyruvate-binding domain-containing protein [Parabacteroides sp. AF18-52]RHR40202.1 hypothetical protein DWX23_09650 [Parabacteroides sp. AF18-52]